MIIKALTVILIIILLACVSKLTMKAICISMKCMTMTATKLIKRLRCKHSKTKYIATYLDTERPGVMRTHHIHECKECGKRIYN